MTVHISIVCDNAAFEEDPGEEVAQILTRLSYQLKNNPVRPGADRQLRDSNGNIVGHCIVTDLSDETWPA